MHDQELVLAPSFLFPNCPHGSLWPGPGCHRAETTTQHLLVGDRTEPWKSALLFLKPAFLWACYAKDKKLFQNSQHDYSWLLICSSACSPWQRWGAHLNEDLRGAPRAEGSAPTEVCASMVQLLPARSAAPSTSWCPCLVCTWWEPCHSGWHSEFSLVWFIYDCVCRERTWGGLRAS